MLTCIFKRSRKTVQEDLLQDSGLHIEWGGEGCTNLSRIFTGDQLHCSVSCLSDERIVVARKQDAMAL